MSRVLLIRHLPRTLSIQEKNELLVQFGAEKVWELSSKKDVVLASFSTHETARTSLSRLHQLQIGKRRLVVEYSEENVPHEERECTDKPSVAVQNMKHFLKLLNAWNTSVDFFQPPPPNLLYKYPDPTDTTFINIIFSLATNKVLYTQVLHLMNKMSLDPPFTPNDEALNFFQEIFKSHFSSLYNENEEIPEPISETESEISSGDEPKAIKPVLPRIRKRKHILPQTKKRTATILSTAAFQQPTKKKIIDQKDVFDEVNLLEQKKISLKVSQELPTQSAPATEVIGEIKKLTVKPASDEKTQETVSDTTEDTSVITKQELLKNRVSFNDMKVLHVYKNYHPGEPSMRLYVKNLAKNVTEEDIKRIYKRYIETIPSEQQQVFDVRVMQEGRMKGQAFVTLPSVEIAQVALHETNGYLLNDKPMVVQFARACNKKPIN